MKAGKTNKDKAYMTSSGEWLFVHDKEGNLVDKFHWKEGMEAIALLQTWTEKDGEDDTNMD